MDKIDEFRGKYYFLSNFSDSKLTYENVSYLNGEAAFQAMKVINPEQRKTFSHLPPNRAKAKGRNVKLRHDWEKVKDNIMYEITVAKFTQNLDLKDKLLKTGNVELIEGNTWNDTYWGVCNGRGKNKLGKILQRVREEIRSGLHG